MKNKDDKTYSDFIVMYKKNSVSKDVNKMESCFIDTIDTISSILGSEEFINIQNNITSNINEMKKLLVSHGLYKI